jgi:hypothetical protein
LGKLTIRLKNIGTTRFVINYTKCGDIILLQGTPGNEKILPAGGEVDLVFNCSKELARMGKVTPGKDVFKATVEFGYYPFGAIDYSKTTTIDVAIKVSG